MGLFKRLHDALRVLVAAEYQMMTKDKVNTYYTNTFKNPNYPIETAVVLERIIDNMNSAEREAKEIIQQNI